MGFGAWPGLHDLVEALVGHDPAHEELTSAHVVQGQRLDLGDVNAHLTVDPAALDTHNNTCTTRGEGVIKQCCGSGSRTVSWIRIRKFPWIQIQNFFLDPEPECFPGSGTFSWIRNWIRIRSYCSGYGSRKNEKADKLNFST